MKKIIIGAVAAISVAVVPVAASYASNPYDAVPACSISADPTLQYSTVTFHCDGYTNPETGVYYNAIDFATPKP